MTRQLTERRNGPYTKNIYIYQTDSYSEKYKLKLCQIPFLYLRPSSFRNIVGAQAFDIVSLYFFVKNLLENELRMSKD